jgi:hypothetical protein
MIVIARLIILTVTVIVGAAGVLANGRHPDAPAAQTPASASAPAE